MNLAIRRPWTQPLILILTLASTLIWAQNPDRWPEFRGEGHKGIAMNQNLPVQWDGESMANIAWKVRIPGLGLSSPVVWDGKVFVTSAVSHVDEPYLRVGLYGESPENPEDYEHRFTVYCLDAKSGKVLWEKVAKTGVPQLPRHIKSSHANCTMAVDGKHVVAFFGSEGLYCYDMKGKLLWQKDLGFLDAGAFDAPQIKWGFASSPVLYDNKVYTICDVNNQSFIAAFDADSGKELWRTNREEVPTWGTPLIVQVGGKPQVVVNGWHRRAAYDALTGQEIWFMDGGGDIPVPTPFEAHDLIYFSSAHGRLRPLYAIKKTAQGDITLKGQATSNEHIAWANLRRGSYQPTPLVYGDILYVVQDNGVLTTYDALTGEQVYRDMPGGERGAYSASTVAADGRIYFNDEFGKIHVVEAGREFKQLATNVMGDELMSTPAIAGKTMFVRTRRFLWAIRDKGDTVAPRTAATEAYAPEKPAFTPPQGELTDGRQILQTAAQACWAVNDYKTDMEILGTGGMAARIPHVKMTFAASASGKIRVEGEIFMAEGQPGMPIYMGYDNKYYYTVDKANKRVDKDFEPGVLGRNAQAVGLGDLGKFGREASFDPELSAPSITLRGTVNVNGVDCYEVYVDYQSENGRPDIWFIGKADFLPHKYIEVYTLPDSGKGELVKILTNLDVKPAFTPDYFAVPTPESL